MHFDGGDTLMTDYEKNTILENWYSAQQLPFSLPARISTQYHLLSILKKTENDYTCILNSLKNGNLYILKCCQTVPLNIARREHDILQNLQSKKAPNSIYIPCSIEYFEEDNLAYLLRDYLYGRSFREYVSASPSDSLQEKDLLQCGIQLCDALEFLHSQNPPIIHRDIKPDNVIFDQYGNYRLIDFGIARYYRREKNCDTANMGSENSAAPEQFGYSQTDARTDIYSLGTLLLYGATCEYDIKKLDYANISGEMKYIIQKCMQFAPRDRYQTASALRHDLQKHENWFFLKQKRRWFLSGAFCGAAICATVSGGIFLLSGSGLQTVPSSSSISREQDTEQRSQAAGFQTVIPASSPTFENLEKTYTFCEPLVEQAVRGILNIPDDEPVTYRDLYRIVCVGIYGRQYFDNIGDVNGSNSPPLMNAEKYPDQEMSRITGELTSLEDFSYMPNLRDLALYNLTLDNLEGLENLNLKHLALGNTEISDITPVSSQTELEWLLLCENKNMTGLGSLARLPSLTQLILSGIAPENDEFLSGMLDELPALEHVYVDEEMYQIITEAYHERTFEVSIY